MKIVNCKTLIANVACVLANAFQDRLVLTIHLFIAAINI